MKTFKWTVPDFSKKKLNPKQLLCIAFGLLASTFFSDDKHPSYQALEEVEEAIKVYYVEHSHLPNNLKFIKDSKLNEKIKYLNITFNSQSNEIRANNNYFPTRSFLSRITFGLIQGESISPINDHGIMIEYRSWYRNQ